MLSAYLDESGTHAGSEICVISGLVAPPLKWERLAVSWGKVLADVGIQDFHASDCATGGGAFKGWEEKDRERLYRRMVNLVVRTAAYRVWAVVIMRDFHRVFRDRKEKLPYPICATLCASRLREIAMRRGADFVIPCVFDQGPKGKRILAAFSRLLGKGNDIYRMGVLSQADRRKMIPLQAADLHAYELYRYFSDQLKSKQRPERCSFTELLKIADGGGCVLNRAELINMRDETVRRKKAGIRKGESVMNLPGRRLDSDHRIDLVLPTVKSNEEL